MIAGNARRGAYSARMTWGVLLIVLAGLAVRALRLTWQPLWWDEGYSIYFATESLPRMLYLTAHDIHPPLYYALLHGWIGIWGGANPVVDRTLSVLLGVAALPLQAWLAWTLFPGRRRVLWLALFLLAASPMHLFYSQEVRMYGLAMLFSMWSSAALWRLVERMKTQSVRQVLGSWPALSYLIATVLGLYTLYYFALVLLAHLVWAAI
ncbi:MAG: hypothetical protein H3C34_05925, partial [Caldilineaceae bacterium]|nr:hypothetical protein [Caldilineaceae bacterium]